MERGQRVFITKKRIDQPFFAGTWEQGEVKITIRTEKHYGTITLIDHDAGQFIVQMDDASLTAYPFHDERVTFL